jgi:hypothetical protein
VELKKGCRWGSSRLVDAQYFAQDVREGLCVAGGGILTDGDIELPVRPEGIAPPLWLVAVVRAGRSMMTSSLAGRAVSAAGSAVKRLMRL